MTESAEFVIESGETNYDLDLGDVLRGGQSMPEAVRIAPVQDGTVLYENQLTKRRSLL